MNAKIIQLSDFVKPSSYDARAMLDPYSLIRQLEEENRKLKEQMQGKETPASPAEPIEKIKPVEYSEYKSDGKRKARAAEPIRSYSDFKNIQNYFLEQNNIRDWALWTIGVSLGFRISDLLSLKYKMFFNPDMSFKDRLFIREQKTSKVNNRLITEAVREALSVLIESLSELPELDSYIFVSKKTKTRLKEEHGWRIISDAGKALRLPFVVGSHTMRKSFANIAACADAVSVDMNAITKVQGLLNHTDQRCTMKYMGVLNTMYDEAMISISNFVLGKTDIDKLFIGTETQMNNIHSKLSIIEDLLTQVEE